MKAEIVFGALAPRLHRQLGRRKSDLKREQADADAITRLRVRGLLTDAEVLRAERRLVNALLARLAKEASDEG